MCRGITISRCDGERNGDKPPNFPTVGKSNSSFELMAMMNDKRKLRQEEMELRQENLKLKEEILQLKRQVGVGASSAARPTPANRYAPPAQPEQALPVAYIALAVVLSLLSVLLGKFAL
ncbi:unnamed protein product [Phaedon cochleariae]|uniref:Uncharacterized protein n=1 Tax=Phaedon cochleariae TaxID=80249 RepID=A0A9N9WYU1_PHACE|nr:unnamed protein product [Phaedon cochleariae]